ncbi:hypothetical protein [Iningainema tapete]|uniref:Uncharacterized protein n=1 Tax=Iningainema tapete BLCC-T55 TaxID=2748662 RepID=A0A8J6XNH7_9CYAN|nr:hypothetical protein [Iningainema tapete]MBD2775180.1 hypothetical protein [Iningainema tapete BLCC-T55]
MTEKTKNRLSSWSQKHEAFCLENQIPPAAKLLWQWLIIQGIGEETEPDLAEFNDWVKKHRGKGYCRLTLKNALAKLVECRVITLIKQYTWRIVKIVTRPLDWLLPKKNLQKQNEIYASQTSNPQSIENEVNSSSYPHNDAGDKEEILEICNEAGINYPPNKPARIFTYSVEEIKLAIASFFIRGGHEKIRNPQGWLIDCLQWRYWEEIGVAL